MSELHSEIFTTEQKRFAYDSERADLVGDITHQALRDFFEFGDRAVLHGAVVFMAGIEFHLNEFHVRKKQLIDTLVQMRREAYLATQEKPKQTPPKESRPDDARIIRIFEQLGGSLVNE